MPARPMPYARTRGPLAYMAIDSATGDMDEMETPPPHHALRPSHPQPPTRDGGEPRSSPECPYPRNSSTHTYTEVEFGTPLPQELWPVKCTCTCTGFAEEKDIKTP